ncbi:MAG: DUF3465 domain-containing protein [Gammaproteobacteria bacterium]
MKKFLYPALLLAVIFIGWVQDNQRSGSAARTGQADDSVDVVIDERRSGVQTEGSGTVIRILADDNEGSRHQRFILRLDSGRTLLIAHNIDLAPRLANLEKGDTVAFNGEYEWNPEGGVIHWTHHDPRGRHVAGWLRHDGRLYQ